MPHHVNLELAVCPGIVVTELAFVGPDICSRGRRALLGVLTDVTGFVRWRGEEELIGNEERSKTGKD